MTDRFPTRDGAAQGASNERTMAAKVDTNSFRTVIQNNPDGSIAMLRTRGGFLEYTTTPVPTTATTEPTGNQRGFVAQRTDAATGVAFHPSVWVSGAPQIFDKKFKPVVKTYYVSELITANNAAQSGFPKWHDVWTLTATGLRINNVAPTFLGGVVLPSFSGIPFFIPVDDTYGTPAQNSAPVKRIFFIGREKVEVVTDGAVVDKPNTELCNKLARTENRAMTCGPSIDRTENKAVLSQLFYTGYSWDSIGGGWAMGVTEVAMLLTPPYVSSADSYPAVEQATATPQIQSPYYAEVEDPVDFPEANIGIYGIAEPGTSGGSGGSATGGAWAVVILPFRGLVYGRPSDGVKYIVKTGSHWVGAISAIDVISGKTVTTTASNDIKKLFNDVQLGYKAFYHQNFADKQYPPGGSMSAPLLGAGGVYDSGTGATTWRIDEPIYQSQLNINPTGRAYNEFIATRLEGSSTFHTQDQSATFGINVDGHSLVAGSLSVEHISGFDQRPFAKPPHYLPYLAAPYSLVGETSGFGVMCRAYLEVDFGLVSPPPAAAYSAVLARQASYTGRVAYSSSEDSGVQISPWGASEVVVPDTTIATLNWTTRDYILHDDVEMVYVYVLGTFSAVAPNASLTVELVIKTRHGEVHKTLYQTTFWYDEMLPTQELETGVRYVQLPRLSVFFTPKYRHQGDFRGAAYTTTLEESARDGDPGATPACLMNFILTLEMFSYIGTQEQRDMQEKGIEEHFVPCNLLEMLYAYVFSSDYGQNEYSRYPVTYRNNFNKLYAELFNVQHAIAFKDNAFIDWAASITGHNPSTTTGIYRT